MTTARTRTVAQAYFTLADDGTGEVVASSADLGQTRRAWLDRVRPYLALARGAISYVVHDDGTAAVLRRTSREVAGVHALLGTAIELTPEVALTAAAWRGWSDELDADAALVDVPLDLLYRPEIVDALRQGALARCDDLARVLAWLFQAPRAPLGIAGCPPAGRLALLWGLWQIGGSELTHRGWTFGTEGDPGPGAPPAAITFRTTWPDGDGLPGRIVVDLGLDQGASPHNEHHANALVYRFEYGFDPPDQSAPPLPQQIPVPVAPVPVVPVPSDGWMPQAPPAGQPVALPPGRAEELVRDLVAARGEPELAAALDRMAYEAADLDDRDDLRAELERAHWAATVIRRYVALDMREAVHDRIVSMAFGTADPDLTAPRARADARRLAEQSTSREIVRALARAPVGIDLAPALARRWLRENPPVAPDPTAGLGRLGRLLHRRGLWMDPARERRFQIYLLVIVLLVGFVLGHFVGGMFW